MISSETKDKYEVISVRRILRKESGNIHGFSPGYICECANGKWLAISTDVVWKESDIMELNTKQTAAKRLRERGYFTRLAQTTTLFDRHYADSNLSASVCLNILKFSVCCCWKAL